MKHRMTGIWRILHVFGRMERAGAELRTLEIMRHIDRTRFRFEFCSLSGLPSNPASLDDEIRALGGEVHLCRLGPFFPVRFYRLLVCRHFDVVHSHVATFSGLILKLAQLRRVTHRIAHFRTTGDGHEDNPVRRFQRAAMSRLIRSSATTILAVSEGAMQSMYGLDWRADGRCRVIHNGFDLTQFNIPVDRMGVRREFGLARDSRLYINVGTIRRCKNHLRLLSIFTHLAQLDPLAHLFVVGRSEAATRSALQNRIRNLGLSGRVTLTGERADIPRLLKASDLLIHPSSREGLPGAVIEACAAEIPVLASDLPGVREIAEYCPSVHFLSLQAADSYWAEMARNVVVWYPDGQRQGRTLDTPHPMCDGPFDIHTVVRQIESVYAQEDTPVRENASGRAFKAGSRELHRLSASVDRDSPESPEPLDPSA